ncbi:MAG: hypothetical protein ACYC1M_08305 [Armatimonadota bacterium]
MRTHTIIICTALVTLASVSSTAAPNTELSNKHYKIILNSTKPSVASIENRSMGSFSTIYKPRVLQPFFAATLREAKPAPGQKARSWSVSSLDFTTRSIKTVKTAKGSSTAWNMLWKAGNQRLEANLLIYTDASLESKWSFTLKSNSELDATFAFPMLDGLKIGPKPEEAFYFHPRFSGLLNDIPIELATTYGQYARMQLMDAYHPSGAGENRPAGLYVVTHDRSMMRKSYELTKRENGVNPIKLRDDYGFPFSDRLKSTEGIGMAVNWMRIPLQSGRPYAVPTVVIGIGAGDWRDALKSYRTWVDTWYKPRDRGAKTSFLHSSFDLFSQPNCDAALAELDKHPTPEYLQFMVQKNRILGDYGYRDDWSLAELQRFVSECKRRGIVTNHYVEGYIASKSTQVWKDHGAEWGQMQGKEYQVGFANQCMWLCHPGWHEWLAGETTRLASDLKLDSIYLDEVGWGTGDKSTSDNPAHNPGRFQQDGAMTGAHNLLRRVRAGLDQVNPDITMYTEGPAVDGLLPYLDGVEDYSCVQFKTYPAAYRIPVHFMRFVFPEFKFADIPDGTPSEIDTQLKLCLFNGTGFMASTEEAGVPGSWLGRIHAILRDHRDAFTELHPTPLVATLANGVYCNRFTSPTKTVFTLFNNNDYPVSGQVLSLPVTANRHWVDLLNLTVLRVDQTRQGARAVMQIAPTDVAVIASLPALLKMRRNGERVWVSVPKSPTADKISLDLLRQDGTLNESRLFTPPSQGFSLAEVTSNGKYRAVLKLYREGVMLDMLALPELSTLDLAPDAVVTGSVRSAEAKVLNKTAGGSYTLRWDDKPRWVQYTWSTPQTFNTSALRCANYFGDVYTPQIYRYLISDDGQKWKAISEINREGKTNFDTQDTLPLVTTRHLRLEIQKGGLWGDASEMVRWRIYCRPSGE